MQLETEAAVGGDLVKHMVVVADAGRNVVQTGFVQPDFGADAGFFGVAADGGVARRAVFWQRGRQQFFGNRRPAEAVAVVGDAGDAEVVRQFEIAVAVADDVAVRRVVGLVGDVGGEQAGFGFAAGAVVFGAVRADVDGVDVDALRGEGLQHFFVRHGEGGLREGGGAEAVLVADDDEAVALLQVQQRRDDAGFVGEFVEAVDLKVGLRFVDKGAVAVNVEGRLHGVLRLGGTGAVGQTPPYRGQLSSARSRAAFSSALPMVMRMWLASPGTWCWSRRMMPASARWRKTASPSWKATSR